MGREAGLGPWKTLRYVFEVALIFLFLWR